MFWQHRADLAGRKRNPGAGLGFRAEMRIKLTLADYPDDMVWIECNKCGRSGRLNKARLMPSTAPTFPCRSYVTSLQRAPGAARCTILARRCSPTWCFKNSNDLGSEAIQPDCPQRRAQAGDAAVCCGMPDLTSTGSATGRRSCTPATCSYGDLPLKFHPTAIRASTVCTPLGAV